MAMLPQTRFVEGSPTNIPHEPINDIHVHKWTMSQLFVPVSESHQFTREDAAKAFHDDLLPAEKRSMHPELIAMEKRINSGMTRDDSLAEFTAETERQEDVAAQKLLRQRDREEKNTIRHVSDRYEFRIKTIDADDVGVDGKRRKAVGWRYGAPLDDRKRGKIKIPTSVP